jgi:phage terminase large subunit
MEAPGFRVLTDRIDTPGGGMFAFTGMADHTAMSIKSYEGFHYAWVEEADSLSERSLGLLRPTIREEGSEIWFSWNPRRRVDPVDKMLRGSNLPPRTVVVQANWRDNPWFPKVLEEEREFDEEHNADTYNHVWEGDYATAIKGAYYAAMIADARRQGRVCHVQPDPLLALRSYHDIGGAGARADHYAIWVVQFVGREVRFLDHYEAQGQPLAAHVDWMRKNGYKDAMIRLPHDGSNTNNVSGLTYADHWRQAGFDVPEPIKNQGLGAAMQRVEALRRLFPQTWWDLKCEPGLEALGSYHSKKDDARQLDLGPLHDWSSHSADAAGLVAIDYNPPKTTFTPRADIFAPRLPDESSTSWLGV